MSNENEDREPSQRQRTLQAWRERDEQINERAQEWADHRQQLNAPAIWQEQRRRIHERLRNEERGG